jgi:hypothetical protein
MEKPVSPRFLNAQPVQVVLPPKGKPLHEIVVTPELERPKPLFLLEAAADAAAESKKGKEKEPLTYSPFAKKRGADAISPRNSVQFDIAPAQAEKDAELSFFFGSVCSLSLPPSSPPSTAQLC